MNQKLYDAIEELKRAYKKWAPQDPDPAVQNTLMHAIIQVIRIHEMGKQ